MPSGSVPAQSSTEPPKQHLHDRVDHGHSAADLLAFCRHIRLRPHIGLELVMDHAEEALGAMLEGETTSRIDLTR